VKQSSRKHHGRWHGGAQAQATGHETKQGFFLHDLVEEGIPFYSAAAVKSVEERPVTRRWLRHSRMAAGVAFSSAPALVVAVWVGDPPPSVESVQGAPTRWINNGGLLGGGDSVSVKSAWGKLYL
jgi:hypothetical protein